MDKHTIKQLIIGEFSLRRVIFSIVFIYTAVLAWAYFQSDHLIFLPPPSTYAPSDDLTFLQTENNLEIAALYLPNPNAPYTLLYSHGNAEDIGQNRSRMERLQELGFAVLIYDYPGYGLSQGKPSEAGAYQAIDAAYQYLTQTLQIPSEQIVAYGRSLGGGAAVDLAARKPLGGLVVESSFISTFRVPIPVKIFPIDKFRNLAKMKRVTCPVLVIHGEQDQTIPFWHGQELYQAAPDPKQFLWVQGADHNNLPQIAGEKYNEALREFKQLLSQ
ncbi:MAG: alpha/beta hydrolase [Microcoleaceae cyanobacterium]